MALELAAQSGNGDSVVAIMEAYPEAATDGTDAEGRYPVEYMLEVGDMCASSEDFAAKLRAAKLLLDALPKCFSRFPFETKEIKVSKDVKPHLQIMVALTRWLPSEPTVDTFNRTCAAWNFGWIGNFRWARRGDCHNSSAHVPRAHFFARCQSVWAKK